MNELFARCEFKEISAALSGANTVVPAVPGRAIRVMGYTLIAAAEVDATWKSNTTAKSGVMSLPAKGGSGPQSALGVLRTAIGEPLVLTLSSAVQVSGHLTFVLE